jgi:hypothetical protein
MYRTNLTGDIRREDRGQINGFSSMTEQERIDSRRAKRKTSDKEKKPHPIRKTLLQKLFGSK